MFKVCPPLPGHRSSIDEIRLLDSDQITVEEKLTVSRTLRNLKPDSKFLYQCVESSAKKLFLQVDCTRIHDRPNPSCDCSTNSDLRAFYNLFKSKPCFKNHQICHFVNVVQAKIDEAICKRTQGFDFRKCKRKIAEYNLIPIELVESSLESSEYELCSCKSESLSAASLKCWERYLRERKCAVRSEENKIKFRHFGELVRVPSEAFEEPSEAFRIGDLGKSDEIGKWGQFHDLVQQVLFANALRRMRTYQQSNPKMPPRCCNDVCVMPPRKDRFEDVDRYKDMESRGFATFSRNLMRWSSCISKKWRSITRSPHQVIHLPSMSYPCELRSTAGRQFIPLQNVQIGRLGWLVNRNAQVIYVHPEKSSFETECILRNLVKIARPDICQSNLLIIVNDEECLCENVEKEYRSGCESLFFTPSVYQRVRNLTVGRRGFIIPGVLCKTDVFIACELRTSIIGPCLSFQERLLNKHYVMSLLNESSIPHPPYAGVRNFSDLCETLSRMITGMACRGSGHWLLKVNRGFCGKQSVLICLDYEECRRHLDKDNLERYLMNVLLKTITINKQIYKEDKKFFAEIERYGGLLMGCPDGECRAVSLGCFIEHDTAQACLRTSADVLRTCGDCGWTDVGYAIPQSVLAEDAVRELVVQLGKAMLLEQYVGYFGVDLVVFSDEDNRLNYWVVDVDPYYTDLISFDDWRRFCLDIPITARFDMGLDSGERTSTACGGAKTDQRYVVCSGKLYIDGLSQCSGDFLVDLCKEHKIAYSSKARAGCMMCPIENEKRAFLLFAVCSDRLQALKYFVRALRALNVASLEKMKSSPFKNDVIDLANEILKKFNIDNLD